MWPSTDPPKGWVVFTVDNVKKWWSCDFWTHPFCTGFAALLAQSRATLKMCLPHLTGLVATAMSVEGNQETLALFKLVQIFSRLSLAYQHWTKSSFRPQMAKAFILEGFKFNSGATSMAARQISWFGNQKNLQDLETVSKSSHIKSSGGWGPSPTPKNSNNHKTVRTANPGRRPGSSNKKLTCYNCGKLGHTQRACRLKKPKYNKPPNPPPHNNK